MEAIPWLWVPLGILAAFGQALGATYKKKSLNSAVGINNLLGVVAYLTAGIILTVCWSIGSGFDFPTLGFDFIQAMIIVVVLNVLASWTLYKALDKEELSKLMPFISLTALFIVPIEYILRGVIPTHIQIFGILLVVTGSVIFAAKKTFTQKTLPSAKYFLVTLVCYSITSPYMAVLVDTSGSGLFSGAVMHLGIGLGFIPLMVITREYKHVISTRSGGRGEYRLFVPMLLAGAITALLENGPTYLALEQANAGEVFALKRTMPFFALILGISMFKEKVTVRHCIGSAFLVAGSVCVILFK